MSRVIAYLAREHGLNGLEALLATGYDVTDVVTHRFLPRSEASTPSERPEFVRYVNLASQHGFRLHTVDSKSEQEVVENHLLMTPFDLIACISWRRLIPAQILSQAAIGGVNVHRGKLPDYAGAEPIKRALEKGDREITLTAHRLTPVIDGGEILAVKTHPVAYREEDTLDTNVERLKQEITPYFGPLLLEGLSKI